MRPDENNNQRSIRPLVPERPLLRNQTSSTPSSKRPDHNQAASNIVRQQIDRIYEKDVENDASNQQTNGSAASQEAQNPYERTQTNPATIQSEHWKKYHSAWQDYYQKYYERYYVGQVYKAQQALEERARAAQEQGEPESAQQHLASAQSEKVAESAGLDRSEALYELRSRLRNKFTQSAQKVRKSRHFVPLSAAACVVVLFLFLQYNRVLFANVEAYISPGNIDPANIIVDPTQTAAISDEPKLIIPKINVDVPVVYDVTPDHDSQMAAMEDGVAWFGIPGANSKPGQIGNTVLSGHSSNDIVDRGDYKFIFARLDQLKEGDTIFVNYEGKRYTYSVTSKEVVKPTQVGKLIYDTDKPILTLITCTPLGTSLNRLLVTAEQISPSPTEAKAAPGENAQNNEPVKMPGNSPTFLERIF